MIIAPPTSDSTSQWAYAMLLELQRQLEQTQDELAALKKSIESSGQ